MDSPHFVHSLADGHLDVVLVITNNAAGNTQVCKLFYGHVFSLLLAGYPGGMMGHVVTHVEHFKEVPDWFPNWLHHFTAPVTVCKDSDFSKSLAICYWRCLRLQLSYILLAVKPLLIVLLVSVSLVTDGKLLFICLWTIHI